MPNRILARLARATERLLTGAPNAPSEAVEAARTAAEAQFRAHVLRDVRGVQLLAFREAEILDQSDSYSALDGEVANYVLSIFLVTDSNQYFLFKSSETGHPFVQHLTEARARTVLKSKFRPHSSAA